MSNEKYLSHRLNGFDAKEASLAALEKAIISHAPFLEIDTRVSKDGTIYISHDDMISSTRRTLSISKSNSSKIDSFIKKHSLEIISLDKLLQVFSKRKYKSQKLMIDIKDYGFEEEHLRLVQKYNLNKNIFWVSWIPQSLLKLDKLDPNTPKILSFIPVNDIFTPITQNISIAKIPFIPIVLIGREYYKSDLKDLARGYQHAYLTYELNNELLALLSKNGGGVCISKNLLTAKQLSFNKTHELLTTVFAAADRKEFKKISKMGVDIVFCDFVDKEIRG